MGKMRRAVVRFLDKSEGGQSTPPRGGFKPHLKIGDEYTSCFIITLDADDSVMEFGVEHTVYLELMFEEHYGDRVHEDMDVRLYEGSRLIGVGRFVPE